MVTTAKPDQQLVTGKINGQEITAPAGTTVLEAARMNGIDIPNLCFQPLLRPWGSCRICTVEILGKRGGMVESCSAIFADGIEVLTHPPEIEQSRQFLLQMYLIDHALDCPTCDKSGECYLQDNTYLHNVHTNPYRRPKFAQSYEHFSSTIDYKWDRCIMCNRCTRVCDEVIGVIAIEADNRGAEATIAPGFGLDLSETACTNCGMCIAVCPVGALTDRHFGHHPWELDTTETICGYCDNGCTLNIEHNKGVVRRVTNLWERGVNHGYTCERGKWGHEAIQNPDRVYYPRLKDNSGVTYEVTWDDAIDSIAERLAHYQGDQFAALASPDSTNEEVYLLQQFTRAVMNTNNIDRALTPAQRAVEQAVQTSLGIDVANTNNMQELFTDVKCAMVVGPNLGQTEPIASYWFYHARLYREAKIIVISQDDYPLGRRGELWLRPNSGTTAILLNGIACQIIELGLGDPDVSKDPSFTAWRDSLKSFTLDQVSQQTGISQDDIKQAAVLFASGGTGNTARPDSGFPPSLLYQTMAHAGQPNFAGSDGDPAGIATACSNLAILTGNIGRAGGGVAALRGPANYQGATQIGAHPATFPGGGDIEDHELRQKFEAAWLPRWGDHATTSNGFLPVRHLPSGRGIGGGELTAAINRGEIKAMYIEGTIAGREQPLDPDLVAALVRLDYLVVADYYDSPLAQLADVVLPLAMYLEKDGTFTSFDRTLQRVRAAVPAAGESQSGFEIIEALAQRMGYHLDHRHPSDVMAEIARVVPGYSGASYARLERGGLSVPVTSFVDTGTPILSANGDGPLTLQPKLVAAHGHTTSPSTTSIGED